MLYNELATNRDTEQPVVWVVGCSISHGTGVEKQQSFGSLVSSYIDMPVRYLTLPGSSIDWASDQIIRSDIRSQDYVIWGLTQVRRFSYYERDGSTVGVTPFYYKNNPSFEKTISQKFLVDANIAYQGALSILRVNNYLEKIGCNNFRYVSLFKSDIYVEEIFKKEIKQLPGYIQCYSPSDPLFTKWIDLGTDNSHPGPEQHKIFAKYILDSFS